MRRTLIAALTTALVVVLAGVASTANSSWTATASANGTATTSRVSITQQGFGSLAATYTNASINPLVTAPTAPQLASTASFTITNTGTLAGPASVTIAAGTGELAANLNRVIWPVTSAAACTATTAVDTPVTPANNTWAQAATFSTPSLAAGAAQTYCVRSSALRTAVADGSGTRSVSASITATLSAGGWAPVTAAETATVTTAAVYPQTSAMMPTNTTLGWVRLPLASNSSQCVSMAGTLVQGQGVTVANCTLSGQTVPLMQASWQLTGTAQNQSVVTLRPGTATTSLLTAGAGGAVTAAAASAQVGVTGGAPEQKWFVQARSTTTYQLVSMLDGRCLGLNGTTMQLVPCNDARTVVIGTPVGVAPSVSLPLLNLNVVLEFDLGIAHGSGEPNYEVRIDRSATGEGSACSLTGAPVKLGTNTSKVTCLMLLTAGQKNYVRVISSTGDIVMRFVSQVNCLALICGTPTISEVSR